MAQGPSRLIQAVTQDVQKMLAGDPSPQALENALRHLAKWRAHLLENTLLQTDGNAVQTGPFKGMRYATRATEGARIARILGCYEATLAPEIEEVIARAYPLVIDVGSAEGYYAVGLATRMPQTRILARDENPKAQESCAALAKANGVADRVEVGGLMDHADFDICKDQETLVICDIEGAEDALLDPAKAPGLLHADILVECHDCMIPGLSDRIAKRFAATHKITRFERATESHALPAWMDRLSDLDRAIALWEWRAGPTPWLWMTRHA
ncbi:MAG TPA: hypothetical protein VJ942_04845 [Roseovarius sp.]|nr:hypothetical protein [Roseovarius sp.]